MQVVKQSNNNRKITFKCYDSVELNTTWKKYYTVTKKIFK